MSTAPLTKIVRCAATAVAVCALAVIARSEPPAKTTGAVGHAPGPAAPAAFQARLGNTTGRLTVVTANVAEYLNVRDNHLHRDLSNFARRAKVVLDAARRSGQPVHTPDLILLQEVDAGTAKAARVRLSRAFGKRYAIAGAGSRRLRPAAGRGAVVHHRTRRHPLLTRATAVLYNTDTMRRPTSAHTITFSYPKRQMWTARHCGHARVKCQPNMWEARQSVIFRLTAKRTHRSYAVASVHFVPYPFLRPRLHKGQRAGFRQARWITHLHKRMSHAYPRSQQIMAGDFNEHLCVDDGAHRGRARCAGTPVTPLYRAVLSAPSYHWAIPAGIDHIFTQPRIVAAGKDSTYKRFGRRRGAYLSAGDYRTRFRRTRAFNRCDAAFSRGAGRSRTTGRIAGCRARYYSDHPLDWAVVA